MLNGIKRELAIWLDGLTKVIHIVAIVISVVAFLRLANPDNTTSAAVIFVIIAAIGLADLALVWPMRAASNRLTSRTRTKGA